jgi:hypothetical protein
MTNPINELSPRSAARIAGIGYLLLFLLGIFANFFVRNGLVEPGDAMATFTNIADAEFLFRLGLVSFLVIFVVDVIVAWALYVLFKAVSKEWSRLAAWFRLVYTTFLGVALVFFFMVLQLVSGAGYLSAFEPGQLDAQAMLLLEAFNYAWLIGLACFGIHLMLIGSMMIASGVAPRALGVVLAIAGSAYVIDTLAKALLSNYADLETLFLVIVAVPAVIGELAFTVWLLTRRDTVVGSPRALEVGGR